MQRVRHRNHARNLRTGATDRKNQTRREGMNPSPTMLRSPLKAVGAGFIPALPGRSRHRIPSGTPGGDEPLPYDAQITSESRRGGVYSPPCPGRSRHRIPSGTPGGDEPLPYDAQITSESRRGGVYPRPAPGRSRHRIPSGTPGGDEPLPYDAQITSESRRGEFYSPPCPGVPDTASRQAPREGMNLSPTMLRSPLKAVGAGSIPTQPRRVSRHRISSPPATSPPHNIGWVRHKTSELNARPSQGPRTRTPSNL